VSASYFQVGALKVEIHGTRRAAGEAAARAAAETMKQVKGTAPDFGVIFATGASQLETLRALTSLPDLPWNRVTGFHMDEYEGTSVNHPASFRRYMREHLTGRVQMREFFEIDGCSADADLVCQEYAKELRLHEPQLCLLGIGENGHLAFNDPAEADFNDPKDVKIVNLDTVCRQQQVEEGWFTRLEDVPKRALTLTIPALLRVPRLIVSVPGSRKARIVRRTLEELVSTVCPATALRKHPDATVYLDQESATELDGLL
jgi:glucosamine-6-phosphate deaminase